MMWGYGNGWGDAWGVIMIIVMLAVVALVVVGVVYLIRGVSRPSGAGHEATVPQYGQSPPPGPSPGGTSRALEIPEERYARGEIDRDEFLRRRQDIVGGGGQ